MLLYIIMNTIVLVKMNMFRMTSRHCLYFGINIVVLYAIYLSYGIILLINTHVDAAIAVGFKLLGRVDFRSHELKKSPLKFGCLLF